MKTSVELIERISPRYKKVRNKNLDFLWEDFLQAVEKAISKLTDEVFATTSGITIFYFTKEGDRNIYRSKIAECISLNDQTVEYEKEDISLGTKEMLELAFIDFKDKAEKDDNISADWFEVEELRFDEDVNSEISLDFKLSNIL